MISKYKENKLIQQKESNTLDNKHRQITKEIKETVNKKQEILDKIENINIEINEIDDKNEIIIFDIERKIILLNKKEELNNLYKVINSNYNEMDYYDNAGDLLSEYYDTNNSQEPLVEVKNIIELLSLKNKSIDNNNDCLKTKHVNKSKLFEKYCHRIDGIRINHDDGTSRIKYCTDCNIEKILDMAESAYICQCCGDCEIIILDDEHQIKDYSPYRRLNHFREWLNQFQAKQTPDIPEIIFIDIVKELNKKRIVNLSTLNKKNMKNILKKLKYNIYYEHIAYIINKLNNLPPPKITRDMEKLFISMFYNIQEPWELYKQVDRKNFLSYSYVLHKFSELLELDHLLEHFPLHVDPNKVIENDLIWEKICKFLKWEYISSFK